MASNIVFLPEQKAVVINGMKDSELGFRWNRFTRFRCWAMRVDTRKHPDPEAEFVRMFCEMFSIERRAVKRLAELEDDEMVTIRRGIGMVHLSRRGDEYRVVHQSGRGNLEDWFTGPLPALERWLGEYAVTPESQRTWAKEIFHKMERGELK